MFKWSIIFDHLPFLLAGAWTTLSLTVVSMIFTVVAGLLVELLKMFWREERERYYARQGPKRGTRECVDMVHKIVTGLLLLALLVTVGCSPKVKPDKTAKDFLDAMVNSDFETAVKFTGGVNPQYELDRILVPAQTLFGSAQVAIEHAVLGQVTYEVGSEEIKGEPSISVLFRP